MSKPRTIADFPNRADDYDEAVSKSHDQNTDTVLDEGGDHEVTAEDIVGHIENEENPHQVTAGQVGAYTKGETDDLLDDKFDKSGGTIEGVTIIETDSANGLEIIRTGSNGGRARLRIINANNSGLAPEFTITGDGTSETPGLPLYIPGRISTRDGFYIGSTRKDREWDAKADQSALDAAEDRIDGLEGSKMDANNPEYSGVVGFWNNDRGTMHRINTWILDYTAATSGYFVLLGRTNANMAVTGVIEAAASSGTSRSGVYCSFSARANSSYQGCSIVSINNPIFRPDFVTCVVDGDEYYALRFSGTNLLWYPSRWYFSGKIGQGGPVELRVASDVSSVTEVSNDDLGVDVLGGIRTTEPITAPDFITASRVESDRQNALSALDNMAEWKKKDGTIDYKKHYAYTPRIIKDEAGKIIEEKPGLSMEKRVAMLEKMVAELSGEIQTGKTQRK